VTSCPDDDLADFFMNLTGKHIFYFDDEYSKTGVIVGRADPETYLVQFDLVDAAPGVSPHAELYTLAEMTEQTWGDGLKCWTFYDTREALDAYVRWLETPAESKGPKLVNLKANAEPKH
jgi:hypothetical protein